MTTNERLNLQELVENLQKELTAQKQSGIRDIPKVGAIMESYNHELDEWKMFEFYDKFRYTRNLIATDGKTFTLMLLCWNNGHKSPIHDHAGSECWVKVLKGNALEELFENPKSEEEELHQTASNLHGEGGVCFINDSIGLHRIANASQETPLVTLHCYSPPFDSCKAFIDGTGKALVCNVCYFSEHGQIIKRE
jgi:cysteine dioxygenase